MGHRQSLDEPFCPLLRASALHEVGESALVYSIGLVFLPRQLRCCHQDDSKPLRQEKVLNLIKQNKKDVTA